jgi:hypothetical protein
MNRFARFALALLAAAAIGCERQSLSDAAGQAEQSEPSLDRGAIRVALVDGIEAAVRDPALAQQLELSQPFEHENVQAAVERLLARATTDPELARIADDFFVSLQDSSAMRTALLEHARQNPEFVASDLTALRETFIADVEQRLTRGEIAEALESQLRASIRASDSLLAEVWASEAGGASLVAERVLARLDDPEFRTKVYGYTGRDDPQSVLVRRFADEKRALHLLTAVLPMSTQALVDILDHERTAALLAESLGRALRDPAVRERCEELFGLALAAELDAPTFRRALSQLLEEPALAREAAAFASALAREEHVERALSPEIERRTKAAPFDAAIERALD